MHDFVGTPHLPLLAGGTGAGVAFTSSASHVVPQPHSRALRTAAENKMDRSKTAAHSVQMLMRRRVVRSCKFHH